MAEQQAAALSPTVRMRSKKIPPGKKEHVIIVARDKIPFYEGRGFTVVSNHEPKPGEISGTGTGTTSVGA